MNARRALTSLAVGETYGELTLSLCLPRPWRGRIQPLRGWPNLVAAAFRRFHLRLMILGPFGTRRKRLVQLQWAVPEGAPGYLKKRFLFYTTEASMSMKTNDSSCTIRENELPQLRPNCTNFAKTGGLVALFARSAQSLVGRRQRGATPERGLVIACDPLALKGRPSEAQANGLGGTGRRMFHFLPPALKGRDSCAFRRSPLQGSTGKTASSPKPTAWAVLGRPFGAMSVQAKTRFEFKTPGNTHLGHCLRLRRAVRMDMMSGICDPVREGLL
jgi:hypothetical protein